MAFSASTLTADISSCVVDGGEHLVAEIVRLLVTSGFGVIGVEPERDELEAVFLELTRKGSP